MKILLALLFVPLLSISQGQQYYVSHVHGKVKHAKTKKLLILGEEISLSDSLLFSSREDFVSVISPEKGSFTLKPDKGPPGSRRNELILTVRRIIVPSLEINTLATRSGNNSTLTEVENYITSLLSDDSSIAIFDSLAIPLSRDAFRERSKRFFFLRFPFNGQIVNKKLEFSSVDSSALFVLLDSSSVSVGALKKVLDTSLTYQLYFRDEESQASTPVTAFKIHWFSKQQLFSEFCVLRSKSPRNSDTDQLMADHILSNYGLVSLERASEIVQQFKSQKCQK